MRRQLGRTRLMAAVLAVALVVAGLATPAAAAGGRAVLRGTYRVLATTPLPGSTEDRHDDVLELPSGRHAFLRLPQGHGLRSGQALEVEGLDDGRDVDVDRYRAGAVASAPATTGTTKVLVILAHWSQPDALTSAKAHEVMFTRGNPWWAEASYGKLQLAGQVTPWFQIAAPADCYNDSGTTMTRAKAAAKAAGYDSASYDRTMVYFPRCNTGAAGWATVGGSNVWMNGFMDLRVSIHEQGHNYGLLHANSLTCTDGATPVTLSGSCTAQEYGDDSDAMGGGLAVGHFSGAMKDKLGWLAHGGGKAVLGASGTVTLTRVGAVGGFKAAQQVLSSSRSYWFELRTPEGIDAALAPGDVGVQIRLVEGTLGEGTPHVLDAQPAAAATALPSNSSWTTPDGTRYSVGAISGGSVTLTVQGGAPPPAAPATPTGVQATALDQAARVTWQRPNDNGSVITSFVVTTSPGGATTTVAGDQTSTEISGLSNGTEYTFTVRAVNGIGTGPASAASAPVTPLVLLPSASITAPAPGTVVESDVLRVEASALPNPVSGKEVWYVQADVDGSYVGFDSQPPFAFDASISWLSDGPHTLRVRATDANSRVGTAEVAFELRRPKPAVAITSPTPGSTLTGETTQVAVTAVPVPGGQIAEVRVESTDGAYADAARDPADANRWVASLPASELEDGLTELVAVAEDGAQRAHRSEPVAIRVDRPKPTVAFTSPAGGTTVLGTVDVVVAASAPAGTGGGIGDVRIEVDGAPANLWLSQQPGGTWSGSVDVSDLADGAHSIVAVATTDTWPYRTGRSAPLAVVVDNPTPTASITSPAAGAQLTGTATVRLTAAPDPQHPQAVSHLELVVGTEVVGYAYQQLDGTWEGTWDTTRGDQGQVSLVAIPVDNEGYRGRSAPVQYVLSNPGPSITITSPASPATHDPSAPLAVAVSVTTGTSPTSPISYVQYELDGASVGYAGQAPWGATLYGLPRGTHVLQARVHDQAGRARRSTPVTVTVASTPDTPDAPVVIPGDQSVQLLWTAPSDGGLPITDYVVQRSTDGGGTWTTFADGTSTATSATVTGLANGTAHRFRVAAVNGRGTSAPSTGSTAVTPRGKPGAPTGLVAAPGNGTVALTWTPAPMNGSPITDHVVQRSTDGGTTWATVDDGASPLAKANLTGLVNGTSYRFRVAAVNAAGTGTPSTPSASVTPQEGLDGPQPFSIVSTEQHTLTGSDGTSWQTLPGLSLTVTPDTSSTAVLTANADLWTHVAGVNQDLGIFVDGQLVAWKESGGFAGTFSPNAAVVEAVVPLSAAAHTIDLRWKANRAVAGSKISVGAGPIDGAFSPTRLSALLLPAGSQSTAQTAVSTAQRILQGNDGTTWVEVPGTTVALNPTQDVTAVLSGNADLWTFDAGVNQDLGILLDGQLVGWKESGGFAGTFSPNAAAVQAVVPLTAGAHTATLVWKANKAVPGSRIAMGAGPIGGQFSPTRLTAVLLPGALAASVASSGQHILEASNGTAWAPVHPSLKLTINASTTRQLALTANADLWTWNPGVNQDLGIFVDGILVAWKESGGFAGTFSPNAAAVTGLTTVGPGTHTVELRWKANKPTAGKITVGAGPIGGAFSPTRLTALVLRAP